MTEDGDPHELPAEIRVHVEERYQYDRAEGKHPDALQREAAGILPLPTRHPQHQEDGCRDEKNH